jgi:hypothetical protein
MPTTCENIYIQLVSIIESVLQLDETGCLDEQVSQAAACLATHVSQANHPQQTSPLK